MRQIGKPFLGFLAFGDVAYVANKRRYSLGRNGSYRQFNRKFCAVRAHCCQLEPLANNRAFAGRKIMRKPAPMGSTKTRWDDQLGHRLAEHCFARTDEHRFGRRIKLQNSSFVIDGQYAIECRLDNAVHQTCALSLRLFGGDAFGDVQGESARQYGLAFPVENRKALRVKEAYAIGRWHLLDARYSLS